MGTNLTENVRQVKHWVTKVHGDDIAPEKLIGAYDDWAKEGGYDQNMKDPKIYRGPSYLCDAVEAMFPASKRKTAKILDVAAGSGLFGKELKARGFVHVDALDPSQGMLEEARKKGIYENYFCDYISDDQLDIKENSYDGITVVGGFGPGHIPAVALHEMLRLVRPGGYIMFVINEDFLTTVVDYRDTLLPLIDGFTAQRKWKQIKRETYDGHFLNVAGVLFIFEVLP